MSKARYVTAIVAAVIAFLFPVIFFSDWDLWMRLIMGYSMGSWIGELIFWDESLSTRVLKFLFHIVAVIFVFWGSWFLSGLLGIVIGCVLTAPLWGAMGSVLTFAFSVFGGMSLFLFPVHLAVYAQDLY